MGQMLNINQLRWRDGRGRNGQEKDKREMLTSNYYVPTLYEVQVTETLYQTYFQQ